MADYMAIADVGDTLIELLRDNMQGFIGSNSIALMSPADVQAGDITLRLTLYLYQITENPYLKNRELPPADPDVLEGSPVVLDLYYMLTSHPASSIVDMTERTLDEHSVLGRAMQILHDNMVLKGSALKRGLSEEDEPLHITQVPASLDDLTKVWTTFHERPFKPSVCYMVTPVVIRSRRELGTKRVEVSRKEKFMQGERP